MIKKTLIILGFIVTGSITPVLAEQALEQAANDPTASLMSLQFSDWHAFNYHQIDDQDNSLVFRSAIPFTIGEQKHIMRMTLPIITDHPALDDGLSDTTIFDLMVFEQSWGRYGVGAVGVLPTGGSNRGTEKWGLGPALGFVAQQEGFLFGLFNQNVFTIAGEEERKDINISSLQPIFSYKLGDGWSTGFSEMQITYDWEASRWSNLPLGAALNKLHRFGKLPVQFSLQYEHNFADDEVAASDIARFTVKFLLPTL